MPRAIASSGSWLEPLLNCWLLLWLVLVVAGRLLSEGSRMLGGAADIPIGCGGVRPPPPRTLPWGGEEADAAPIIAAPLLPLGGLAPRPWAPRRKP